MKKKQNGHGHHWSYEKETAPEFWGDLNYDFILCKNGKKQSPINIITTDTERVILPELYFSYEKIPLRMINNGHTIQVNCKKGSFLHFETSKYELLLFHFHRKSEHTIDGNQFDMELQLVHKNQNDGILIISVLLEEGKTNTAIQEIWKYIDEEEKPEFIVHGSFIDVTNLLPENLSYYLYSGSLTTPGCDEHVTWIVLKEPVQISLAQIEQFELIFPNNSRPIQPLNGRVVRECK